MIFEISDVVDTIRIAQKRADKLREAQAVVVRNDTLTITPAKNARDALEICWPCKREVCA